MTTRDSKSDSSSPVARLPLERLIEIIERMRSTQQRWAHHVHDPQEVVYGNVVDDWADELAELAALPSLERLIEQWRERVLYWRHRADDVDGSGVCADTYEVCADELAACLGAPQEKESCVTCGASESADGDWYRLCGTCRWKGAAVQPPSQAWHDIASAPKDGTPRILGAVGEKSVLGFWSQRLGYWLQIGAATPTQLYLTHWMPLPLPPPSQEKEP